MEEKTGYLVMCGPEDRSVFRPIYIFSTREEAEKEQKELQKLHDLYNEKLTNLSLPYDIEESEKSNYKIGSVIVIVDDIKCRISDDKTNHQLLNHETVYGVYKDLKEMILYSSKEECLEMKSSLSDEWQWYILSITDAKHSMQNLIATCDEYLGNRI